jgi:hypothetical protein
MQREEQFFHFRKRVTDQIRGYAPAGNHTGNGELKLLKNPYFKFKFDYFSQIIA